MDQVALKPIFSVVFTSFSLLDRSRTNGLDNRSVPALPKLGFGPQTPYFRVTM